MIAFIDEVQRDYFRTRELRHAMAFIRELWHALTSARRWGTAPTWVLCPGHPEGCWPVAALERAALRCPLFRPHHHRYHSLRQATLHLVSVNGSAFFGPWQVSTNTSCRRAPVNAFWRMAPSTPRDGFATAQGLRHSRRLVEACKPIVATPVDAYNEKV